MNGIHDQYEIRKTTPELWVLEARRLKVGGDLLFDAYKKDLDLLEKNGNPLILKNLELSKVASLIFGLAIEDLLKAIILSKTQQLKMNHKLIDLSEKAGITLTDVQSDIVKRLQTYVVWSGRYPVPKTKNDMLLNQRASNRDSFPLPLQPFERPIYNDLYDLLEKSVI
jgi:hypothetical protein